MSYRFMSGRWWPWCQSKPEIRPSERGPAQSQVTSSSTGILPSSTVNLIQSRWPRGMNTLLQFTLIDVSRCVQKDTRTYIFNKLGDKIGLWSVTIHHSKMVVSYRLTASYIDVGCRTQHSPIYGHSGRVLYDLVWLSTGWCCPYLQDNYTIIWFP